MKKKNINYIDMNLRLITWESNANPLYQVAIRLLPFIKLLIITPFWEQQEIRRWVTLCKVQQSTFCPLLRRRIRLRCSFRRASEALPYLAVGPALKGENYWEILPVHPLRKCWKTSDEDLWTIPIAYRHHPSITLLKHTVFFFLGGGGLISRKSSLGFLKI